VWQSFTKITLPFLAPMIAITVLLRTIWVANFADLVYIMTGGGPANSTQILPTYIFTTAFRKLDFGYASAISVVLLLLLLLYAGILLRMRQTLIKI
jgi:multiple sugar transport system permease protein